MTDPDPPLALALKALIKGDGSRAWKGRIARDTAPERMSFPYITYSDLAADVPALVGDSRVLKRRRLITVSLYHKAEDTDATIEANRRTLYGVLEDAQVASDEHVYGCRVDSVVELPPEPASLPKYVQHAFTVGISYQPA